MKYNNWCDEMGWIPNIVGYSVHLKLKDGNTATTQVILDASGCHCLEGVLINNVLAWRSA
jgi:hypothetical protein